MTRTQTTTAKPDRHHYFLRTLMVAVAVMAAMVALTVAPAFASPPSYRCVSPDGISYYFVKKGEAKKLQASGYTCIATSTL